MNMPLNEIAAYAACGLAFLAAVFSLLAMLRAGRFSQEKVGDAVRGACGELRSEQSAGMSQLRQEITRNMQGVGKGQADVLQQLSQHQKERLDKVAATLSDLTRSMKEDQQALRGGVETKLEAIRAENMSKLEEMRKTVDEKLQSTLEKRLSESFNLVSEQLERVHKGLGDMQSLATGVGDLKKVLTNVKARGTWGEVQLGALLEQFLSPEQYFVNAQIKEGSAQRVEYAVRFYGRGGTGEVLIPIDAKFPQEDFERLIAAAEAGNKEETDIASRELEKRVRSFAKDIADKYISPPRTADYAILFIPTESLYAEILRRPGYFESLQRDFRVTLAGPTTLTAMLLAFQMAFRSVALEERADEVRQLLSAVRTEFDKHGDVVGTLQRQLSAAINTVDKLGVRTRMMDNRLKKVGTMEAGQATALLGLDALEEPEEVPQKQQDVA
jgi:DNA recombination protein RmuC